MRALTLPLLLATSAALCACDRSPETPRKATADSADLAIGEGRSFARSSSERPDQTRVERVVLNDRGIVCGFVDLADGRGWRAFYYLPTERFGQVLKALEEPAPWKAEFDGVGCPVR